MKLLLYCTKAKPYLRSHSEYEYNEKGAIPETRKRVFTLSRDKCNYYNGKIVAECDYEVEEIEYSLIIANNKPYHYYEPQNTFVDKFYEKSCLNHQQVEEYLGYKNGYAIHIKNLHIFDKPRELSDYYKIDSSITLREVINRTKPVYIPINKAPQNMMYCHGKKIGERYILISIKPEWLCKILNGEKTIEVRKKVLKEMLKNE